MFCARQTLRPPVLAVSRTAPCLAVPEARVVSQAAAVANEGDGVSVAPQIEKFSQAERSYAVSILFAVCACVFDLVLVLPNVELRGGPLAARPT